MKQTAAEDVYVREYRGADGMELAALVTQSAETRFVQGGHWAADEPVVVICRGSELLGFAAAERLPGLEGHYNLQLFIGGRFRRQGYGTLLWQQFQPYLREAGVRLVSTWVAALDEPLARFLQEQGFFLEHVEWGMERPELVDVEEPVFPAGYGLRTYGRREAARLFRELYEAAFSGEPSYQPYESVTDVLQELDEGRDLLFLVGEERPVGFAWLRVRGGRGRIEPIGIVREYQGRGFGRVLLQGALYALRGRGCDTAGLGVWESNERAIRLYEQSGFQHVSTRYYLAYSLAD